MLSAIIGGTNIRHSKDFFMDRPYGVPNYLFLLIKSRALIKIQNHSYDIEPFTAILIQPNTPYSYSNPYGEYINDYLHFNCTNATCLPMEMSSQIIHKPFSIASHSRYTMLLELLLHEHLYGDQTTNIENEEYFLKILLNHLSSVSKSNSSQHENHPLYAKLSSLRIRMMAAPDEEYSLDEIATSFKISTSHFQHLYSTFFQTSFRSDLIHIRIEQAKTLLTTTDFKTSRVASLCGYSSEVHFFRQFKQITKTTPSAYRNAF